MKSPLTLPAIIFAIAFLLTALILHHGLTTAADHLANAVDNHAASLADHIDRHADTVQHPSLTFVNPVDIKQPVTIQGPHEDRSLSVNGRLGK